MMRMFYIVGVVFSLYSCKSEDNKTVETLTNPAVKTDTINKSEIKPENFLEGDDFFLAFLEKFILNDRFQKSRVNFPIIVGEKEVNKSEWEKIEIYSQKEFLSFLVPKELSFDSGTSLSDSITVDIFDFSTLNLASYDFVKTEKKWQLDKVSFPKQDEIKENQFLSFLIQFSQNIDYQRNHIIFPIQEIVLKYENNSIEETETSIPLENWEFFSLLEEIGTLIIVNGAHIDNIQKTIYLRGIENGISIEYYFENIKGEWKFVKIGDHST